MSLIFGYVRLFRALAPALSLAVSIWVVARLARRHELLEVVRVVVQTLATVTSPVRIALTLAVLLAVFAARRLRSASLNASARGTCSA